MVLLLLAGSEGRCESTELIFCAEDANGNGEHKLIYALVGLYIRLLGIKGGTPSYNKILGALLHYAQQIIKCTASRRRFTTLRLIYYTHPVTVSS
jgi:hypothetical protein